MAQQSPPALSNQIGENGTLRLESVDVVQAVALLADLGEAGEDEAKEPAHDGRPCCFPNRQACSMLCAEWAGTNTKRNGRCLLPNA
jgi:hypothetical protein